MSLKADIVEVIKRKDGKTPEQKADEIMELAADYYMPRDAEMWDS